MSNHSTGVEVSIGSKGQCLFCFETCTIEGRKGRVSKFQNKAHRTFGPRNTSTTVNAISTQNAISSTLHVVTSSIIWRYTSNSYTTQTFASVLWQQKVRDHSNFKTASVDIPLRSQVIWQRKWTRGHVLLYPYYIWQLIRLSKLNAPIVIFAFFLKSIIPRSVRIRRRWEIASRPFASKSEIGPDVGGERFWRNMGNIFSEKGLDYTLLWKEPAPWPRPALLAVGTSCFLGASRRYELVKCSSLTRPARWRGGGGEEFWVRDVVRTVMGLIYKHQQCTEIIASYDICRIPLWLFLPTQCTCFRGAFSRYYMAELIL